MQISHRLRQLVASSSLVLVCLVTQTQALARTQEANLIRLTTTAEQIADKPSGVRGDLMLASDGNIYFTTASGGEGFGSIGRVAPDGTITTLYAFANSEQGLSPYAGVIQASDGNLYGTTFLGGSDGGGTVFRVTLAGVHTVLRSLGQTRTDSALPYGGLVQAGDGHLYGTTLRSGTNDKGAIFRITLAGEFTLIHNFNGADGENPEGTLALGIDGELYGTTLQGGSSNRGTVFRISTAGVLTTLYSFPSLSAFNTQGIAVNATGANPRAGLLRAADGDFYGTAYQGGPGGHGTLFRVTAAGALSVVHAFTGPTRGGSRPLAGVVQDANGNFYGTSEGGGYLNQGTAWRVSPAGEFTLLHAFVNSTTDGAVPISGLLLANNSIYGASSTDSLLNQGGIFKLDTGSNGQLPVELSVSPADMERGSSATITWSSPTAVTCTATGSWTNGDIAASGTQAVTPTSAGNYTYGLSCTDGAGVVRSAYTALAVRAPPLEPVDGGGGTGSMSILLLLLLAALLFRKNLKEIFTA